MPAVAAGRVTFYQVCASTFREQFVALGMDPWWIQRGAPVLIKKSTDLPYSKVTPKGLSTNRRKFLAAAGILSTTAMGPGLADLFAAHAPAVAAKLPGVVKGPYSTDEKVTPENDVTHYNNFYEFGAEKDEPARNAGSFRTRPWTVSVEGLVNKPQKYDIDSLMKLATLEERNYRHRCVEGWSIVVPWIGFPLSVVLKAAEPQSKANYVAFTSYYSIAEMPQSRGTGIEFPYVEGLRLDEAVHPLALLTFGMYGEELPKQDGAPVRMVLPWKYGFKSIKSIIRIKLVEREPPTTWNMAAPREYGFYSNVNPQVDHPRWSQATERRLGEFFRRKTLMFNGYADQVAHLYQGMDLKKYY